MEKAIKMGAQTYLIGLKNEITTNDLNDIIDFEKLNDTNNDFELFFENGIKKYCFELNEMFIYYFLNFRWEGELEIKKSNNTYLLEKKLVLGLLDWFITLADIFNTEIDDFNVQVNEHYLIEAEKIKANYENKYEFFSLRLGHLIEVKEKINLSKIERFLWIYSF